MGIWKILGIYVVISGIISFYAIINSPVMDDHGNIVGESKLTKWKKKLKK
jgi:hypothetical protein|tara:strand:+ start:262 stop:411 length:150 start_codon:yes stop_codon:yes gene_type:complete